MATSHIPTDLGWLTVAGHPPHEGPHTLDVYTQGGQLYLKVTVNGFYTEFSSRLTLKFTQVVRLKAVVSKE